jgi:DNA-binding NtrC family response regulator
MKGRILILQDRQGTTAGLNPMLVEAGHDVAMAADLSDAINQMGTRTIDVLITAGDPGGVAPADMLRQIRLVSEELQVLVITDGGASMLNAIEAFQRSAFAFVPNPIDANQLRVTVQRALEYVHLLRENNAFKNGDLASALAGRPLAEVEKQVILSTLERFKGHRLRTATALGIGLRTLGMKIKRWKEEGQLIETR